MILGMKIDKPRNAVRDVEILFYELFAFYFIEYKNK